VAYTLKNDDDDDDDDDDDICTTGITEFSCTHSRFSLMYVLTR